MSNRNECISFDTGEHIFPKGEPIESILVSGKGVLDIWIPAAEESTVSTDSSRHRFRVLSLETDSFPIGFPDLYSADKTYGFEYLFMGSDAFGHHSAESLQKHEPFLEQPEWGLQLTLKGLHFVQSLYQSLTELIAFNQEVNQFIGCASAFYWFLKEAHPTNRYPKLKVLAEGMRHYQQLKKTRSSPEEISIDQFETYLGWFPVAPMAQDCVYIGEYISTLCNMKSDLRNCFLKEDPQLLIYHCTESSLALRKFGELLKNELNASVQLLSRVFCNTEEGLITEYLRTVSEISQNGTDSSKILALIAYLCDKFKGFVSWFEERYEANLGINLYKLNHLMESLHPGTHVSMESNPTDESIPPELVGSMDRILSYSGLETEKISFFKKFIEHFKEYKPKIDQLPAENKRKLNAIFFELYEAVLLRVIREEPQDKALDLFLVYGFVDPDLLSPKQVRGLFNLLAQYDQQGQVYSIKNWLIQVALKNKSPSVNELGVSYAQVLKEAKARNKAMNPDNGEYRLHYEIMNMFQTNHRVCCGQISSYFPILHNDMLPDDISRFAVTPNKVRDSLAEILAKDYSAFHREVFYSGEKEAFKKEIVLKPVMPDIILIPIVGTRALMWQELSEASKSSPGRLILPILTPEDLTIMLIRLVGQYRWELCRSMMGVRWNDVSCNSLTAAYADYIENYKKNKNLTTEAKERLFTQIKRYQNNLRNIFTADYEQWLRYEYHGMRKLNKEARSILYRFCPFPHKQRQHFALQPVFADIALRFDNERQKLVKEMESRYAHYLKRGHTLEPELEENLRFHKEM